MSDSELLAVLIHTGVKGKSELASTGLRKAAPWQVLDFTGIEGVGEAKACQILAALELARRHFLHPEHRIRKPQEVFPYVRHIAKKTLEYFVCVSLSRAHEVI